MQTSPQVSADGKRWVDATCPKHGPYQAPVQEGPFDTVITGKCVACTNDAYVEKLAREAQAAENKRRSQVAQLNADAGIPVRFVERTLDNFQATETGQKRILATARKFVTTWGEQSAKGTSLIFTGGPGTGKTHVACAIGKALMENNLAAVWFGTITEAMRSIKDTYRKDSERTEQQAINSLLDYDLLILDEVFGSLDDTRRGNVVELLRKLNDRFEQVIVITHIEQVREGLDRVLVVRFDAERGTSIVTPGT